MLVDPSTVSFEAEDIRADEELLMCAPPSDDMPVLLAVANALANV